jgi:hypothetical protein
MNRYLLIIFLSLIFSNNAFSQNNNKKVVKNVNDFRNNHSDFFHLYSTERTDLRLGYLREFSAEEDFGTNEYDLDNFFAEGLFQASTSKDTFFSFGGNFDVRKYDISNNKFNFSNDSSEQLYKIAFSPGFGTFINDDFLIWGQTQIGNFSDLDDGFFNLDDYLVLGRIELIYRLNPSAQLIFGAAYSNDYLTQNLLPILGLRLMSDTGAFQLAIDAPFRIRVGYYLNPRIEVFSQVVAKGDRYNIRLNGDEFTVGVHDERAGGGIRFWLGNHVSLTFEGGQTLNSQFKFYRDSLKSQFSDGDIKPHWFAQSYLGLAF